MTTLNLYETIQRIVQEELRRMRLAELAIVQEQHPHAGESDKDNYACTVQLRDSGTVLGHVPVATGRAGLAAIPAVGDLVMVQYLNGDGNAPVITGTFYNDEDRPPPNDDGQIVLHLPLSAGEGEAVHLELHSQDKREIVIKLGSGVRISLRDDDPAIELDVDGRATVQIARDGAVALKGSEITIEGTTITVEAQSELKLKGGVVNIN